MISTSYLLLNQVSPRPLHLMSSFLMCGPHPYPFLIVFITIVDHFTNYIWFYSLHRKSNAHSTFVAFKQLVENYFTTTIKTLYTNNGGEFLALRSFLATHGITHLTTPHHSPEHNGYSERRHQHIVEMGFTLLHHASIPLTFWSYAFATIVYLINRIPKVSLSLGSLFEKLFHKVPNPSKLLVFGCLCFPWLWPTLPKNSTPNLVHVSFSATPLLRVPSFVLTPLSKKYVSHHVKFVENVFLFSSLIHSPPPHIAGNRHKLCFPCFIVHLQQPSSTAELNRPPEYFLITPPDLPPMNIPLACTVELHRPLEYLPITLLDLSLTCIPDLTHTFPSIVSLCWSVGSDTSPSSPSHTPNPFPTKPSSHANLI